MVLTLEHMHAKARTVLCHHMWVRHRAAHQAGFKVTFSAALKHPVEWLIGRNLRPACRQRDTDRGEFVVAHRLKTGQHQHWGKSV